MRDCCDPTSPSPDPVVVRLQAEVAELKAELKNRIRLQQSLDEIYTVANLSEKLLQAHQELEATREQLRHQTKSFCTHCGKLFPKGNEGVEQFRQHIAECNKHPLHSMAADLSTLRGLLREACEYEVWVSRGEREYAMSADWRKRAQAALEEKP